MLLTEASHDVLAKLTQHLVACAWRRQTEQRQHVLGPRWWAPHYEDGEEARWWGDAAGLVDGYLHNDWESPLPAALDYLLVLPSPHGWGPGIVGRLQALRVDVVSFEMARTPQRHAAILAAVKADGRSVRYC